MIRLFETRCSDEEILAAERVLRSGQLVMADEVAHLEGELTDYLGQGAVTCASGTDALVLALREITEPGAEVIVPAMTFSATYEAVLLAGGTPVVVDVEHDGLTPSLAKVAELITRRTGAVVIVHLYGYPALGIENIADLCRVRGVSLVEDCAQAFGASIGRKKVGTIGDAGTFSFYPTKPLGGIGDGGAVTFRNPGRTMHARRRRNHGRQGGIQTEPGTNSRLDEVNAAVLRLRLARYSETLDHLRALSATYDNHLASQAVSWGRWENTAPYVYPVSTEHRPALIQHLAAHGVEARPHYDPAVSGLPYVAANCPVADEAAGRVLSLPCHRGMTIADVERVAGLVTSFWSAA